MNYRYHKSMFLNFYYIHKQAKKLKIVILNFFFTLILINNNLKIFFYILSTNPSNIPKNSNYLSNFKKIFLFYICFKEYINNFPL